MHIDPEIGSVSIVLRGSFNPKIFHPFWFVQNQIVDEKMLSSEDVEVMHQEVCVIKPEWAEIRVETTSFMITSYESPFVNILDFVQKTFSENLSHTPIEKLGINRTVHFSVGGSSAQDRLGMKLAPPDVWGDWGPKITAGEGESRGGLRSVTMEQRELDDRPHGCIRAQLGPSIIVKNGVYMSVNDHYEIENSDSAIGCDEIMGILQNSFENSLINSEWIIDQIQAQVE